MAMVADNDALDLVVEPHEHTLQDREAFRRAIENRRDCQRDARLSGQAELLTQWRKASPQKNAD